MAMSDEIWIDDLRSGDLLLLAGTAPAHVATRRLMRSSLPWTQVALALRLPGCNGPLLFASTLDGFAPDVATGRTHQGVQTTSLREHLAAFAGAVVVRRPEPFPIDAVSALLAFRCRVKGRGFKDAILEMARARTRRNDSWDSSRLFCSELVAAAYQAAGILRPFPAGRLPNNYMPIDFCRAAQSLDLAPGVVFGPEMRLIVDRRPAVFGCTGSARDQITAS